MTVLEEYSVREHAADVVRADRIVKMAKNVAQMHYPDVDACDEDAFAQCLIDTNAFTLETLVGPYGEPRVYKLFSLFASDCAVDNGCTSTCINQVFNRMPDGNQIDYGYDDYGINDDMPVAVAEDVGDAPDEVDAVATTTTTYTTRTSTYRDRY